MRRKAFKKWNKGDAGFPPLREQRNMLCDKLGFMASESYKQLRTNLLFALPSDKPCRIIGVTSSIRGEGKSTTSINLSYTLAETGKRVLLIDADMRLPSVAKKLGATSKPGLSNFLAGLCKESEAINDSTFFDNWHIMPAGDIPPNPSELLGSEQMGKMLAAISKKYDYIVVDLPPVDIVSDALAIAHWVDGIIVVVHANYTDRRSLGECMRQLHVLGSKILGFVMTGVEEQQKSYGRYGKKYYGDDHGYGYGYGYGYGDNGAKRQDHRSLQELKKDAVATSVNTPEKEESGAVQTSAPAAASERVRPRRKAAEGESKKRRPVEKAKADTDDSAVWFKAENTKKDD